MRLFTFRARVFTAVFAVSFLLRLAVAQVSGLLFNFAHTEMLLIGMSLASGGGFAHQYGYPTGPTAHSTPPFPLFLGAILYIFGAGPAGQAVIATSTCSVSALRCALTPLFAEDAGLGPAAAILSGVLSAAYIGALRTDVSGALDGPFVALALLAIVWMSLRLWRSAYWQTRTPIGFFAVCGFSVLLNPQMIPVIAGILTAGFFACAPGLRKRFAGQSLVLGVCIFFFLLPWGLRNWVEMDSFIMLRSDFGLELWLSNGPGRSVEMPPNERFSPYKDQEEGRKFLRFGEVEYNRQKLHEALSWIQSNPATFARMTLRRFIAWWFPPGAPALVALKAPITILAFHGLLILWRRNRLLAVLFAVTWATLPDLYYFIQWSSRYRYPMDWQLLTCAAISLHSFFSNNPQHLVASAMRHTTNSA